MRIDNVGQETERLLDSWRTVCVENIVFCAGGRGEVNAII